MKSLLRNYHKDHLKYYKALNVAADASLEDIKNAYLRQVKILHPDHNRISEMKFIEVINAWNVLKDPVKKAQYDLQGKVNNENDLTKPEDIKAFYREKEKFDIDDLLMHKSPESIALKSVVVLSAFFITRYFYLKSLKVPKDE